MHSVVQKSLVAKNPGNRNGTKKSRFTDRVKEGRKGLPLSGTGYEKGAFVFYYSNRYAKLLEFLVSS